MSERAENHEVDPDRLAQEEADAAAAEAAAIGGPVPDDDLDPAERPVAEGGGGVAEGFELAEEELIERATHEEAGGYPLEDAFPPEPEQDRTTAVDGEADEINPADRPDAAA